MLKLARFFKRNWFFIAQLLIIAVVMIVSLRLSKVDMMIVLASIALTVVLMSLSSTASLMFEEPKKTAVIRYLVLGLPIGYINALAAKVPISIALLFLIVVLTAQFYLVFWWQEEGSSGVEFLIFAAMEILTGLTGMATSVRVIDTGWHPIWISFIKVVPAVLAVVTIGFFAMDMFWFRAKIVEVGEELIDDDEEEEDDELEELEQEEEDEQLEEVS